MVNNMISRAAVLLAALASTASAGKAIIQNSCSFPVYLSSVSNTAGPTQELAANGGTYTENWRANPNGGGISIKIAADKAFSEITQFEYTLEDPELWYDLSNINGYPFKNWGVSIIPCRHFLQRGHLPRWCRSLLCCLQHTYRGLGYCHVLLCF